MATEEEIIQNHPLFKWRHKFDPPITQDQVAEKIGCHRTTVIDNERCRQSPQKKFRQGVEKITGGKVTAKKLVRYYWKNN